MILIIIGLFGLWLGTRWVINGALGLAGILKLSHAFVGLAVLSVGTDLPEVFVTLKASLLQLQGIESSGIIIGNAVGSSICQITIILGVAGILLSFNMNKTIQLLNGTFLLGSTLMVFLFGLDGTINRLEGLTLLVMYGIYYWLLVRTATDNSSDADSKVPSRLFITLSLLAGFIMLIFSSHIVVDNAMLLANKWGIDQSFVGIAIIGLGTSLPELAVSIGAAMRKSGEMSMGNIIGSNIFDGLVPIGLGSIVSTTKMESGLLSFDLPLLFSVSVLVMIFLRTKRGISKIEGMILVFAYFIYMMLKISDQ